MTKDSHAWHRPFQRLNHLIKRRAAARKETSMIRSILCKAAEDIRTCLNNSTLREMGEAYDGPLRERVEKLSNEIDAIVREMDLQPGLRVLATGSVVISKNPLSGL